ncbi:hypothetical protein MX652_04180 [Thauera aromatica]|nr:hypothetical protein [Thauera aromatica]MCK2125885.1 hypothetical protein [Thauera aromatica]
MPTDVEIMARIAARQQQAVAIRPQEGAAGMPARRKVAITAGGASDGFPVPVEEAGQS